MNSILLHASHWKDYALLDSGDGDKLERFGPYIFSRPEPQAIWKKNLSSKIWTNISGKFISSSSTDNDQIVGKWSLEKKLPNKWEMNFENLKFFATPTPFRHLGFFPDQSPHWLWAAKKN